jgi:hypothetical protein
MAIGAALRESAITTAPKPVTVLPQPSQLANLRTGLIRKYAENSCDLLAIELTPGRPTNLTPPRRF